MSGQTPAMWLDLTVENATAVRDFYQQVAGFAAEPVSMGDYDDYVLKESPSGAALGGVCHARGSNAGLPSVWLTVRAASWPVSTCAAVSGSRFSSGDFCDTAASPDGRPCGPRFWASSRTGTALTHTPFAGRSQGASKSLPRPQQPEEVSWRPALQNRPIGREVLPYDRRAQTPPVPKTSSYRPHRFGCAGGPHPPASSPEARGSHLDHGRCDSHRPVRGAVPVPPARASRSRPLRHIAQPCETGRQRQPVL